MASGAIRHGLDDRVRLGSLSGLALEPELQHEKVGVFEYAVLSRHLLYTQRVTGSTFYVEGSVLPQTQHCCVCKRGRLPEPCLIYFIFYFS